ncbi:MAG: hypothetical protein GX442_09810 [Candidatus Riflebacteria bacterium]|nr:hypothetical protein [Candidatus Riflebacteria bacterium]
MRRSNPLFLLPGLPRRHSRAGIIYVLIIFALIGVVFFVSTISSLNRNYRRQVSFTDQKQLSFLIAYSVLSKTLARIHMEPWSKRFFKGQPCRETNVPLYGGEFSTYLEDSPGKVLQFDLYVVVSLGGKNELFFWRIVTNDDFFDISNRFQIKFFTMAEPSEFPRDAATAGRFASYIDGLLATRKTNQPASDLMAGRLQTLDDTREIAKILGARVPELPGSTAPGEFSPNTPLTGQGEGPPSIPTPPVGTPPPTTVAGSTPPSSDPPGGTTTSPPPAGTSSPPGTMTDDEVNTYLDQIRGIIAATKKKVAQDLPAVARPEFINQVDQVTAELESYAQTALNAPTPEARAKAVQAIKNAAARAQKVADQVEAAVAALTGGLGQFGF